MRKLFYLLITLTLAMSMSFTAYAARVGDVVGNIYSTDILAYIDGMAIQSYNIGGKTVVSENDLADYGFEVVWNAADRLLTVSTKDTPVSLPPVNVGRGRIGQVVGKVYSTDISVMVNGIYVDAYNIGGVTMIALEDFGGKEPVSNPNHAIGYTVNGFRATWASEERTISLDTLRMNNVIRLNGAEYEISELYNAVAPTLGILSYIESAEKIELRNEAAMLRSGLYPEDTLRVIFSEGWVLKDGNLTITVNNQNKKVTLQGINDKNIADFVGCYHLGYYASNSIHPATIPAVIVPTKIVRDGVISQANISGYVYEGKLLFDVETILEMAGLLI